MLFKWFAVFILFVISVGNFASKSVHPNVFALELKATIDHSNWDKLLKKHVDDLGNVDYNGFIKDAIILEKYLTHLAKNRPTENASKPERLAYYINLYNAATVQLVIDNYPIKSIKDIKNPWGKKVVRVGNEKISLGDLEHKILRKMEEPRIHFAINCASYSCPKLLNKAFSAINLETLLEQITNDFVNDPMKNKISTEKAALSEIFKWYKKDFTTRGALLDFINKYTSEKLKPDIEIRFLKYNWALNDIK